VRLFLLVVALCAGGCATPLPAPWIATTTAADGGVVQPVRTLRRIALLAPAYEIDGKVDRPWSAEVEDARLRDEIPRHLFDWKGYVTLLVPAGGAGATDEIGTLRERLLAHEIVAAGNAPLPPELAAALRTLAATQRVDGVALLGVRFVGLDAARWGRLYGLTFFTLGVGMYGYLGTLGTYTLAAIYDASGQVLWRARAHAGSFGTPLDAADVGRIAFDSLPPALLPRRSE